MTLVKGLRGMSTSNNAFNFLRIPCVHLEVYILHNVQYCTTLIDSQVLQYL
jgi:hypothetical protein